MKPILLTAALLACCLCCGRPAEARVDPDSKKVAIVIFNTVQVIDYSGPLEVLSDAGFDVFTVAESRDPVTTSAGDAVKLTPKYSFADAPQPDLIVIPGGGFEAAKDSATVAWIKKAAERSEHVMSVCNGAFTLANTGLLDGLSATTTAGNINRFRRTYPGIKVVTDKRVVDNGKILATAGLSAGIDGALHMVDVMKGEGAGRTVALYMELDRHDAGKARGTNADRLIPRITRDASVGSPFDYDIKGDDNGWETIGYYKTKLTPAEMSKLATVAVEKAYRDAGPSAPWLPESFKMEPSGPSKTSFRFDERDGHHWKGVIEITPVAGAAEQVELHLAIDRS